MFKLQDDYPALVLFDHFSDQMMESVLKLLNENHIHRVAIPANCTDRLQRLDVSVNKAAKEFLWQKFHDWYAQKICAQLEEQPIVPVNLRLIVLLNQLEPSGWLYFMTISKQSLKL